MEYVGTTSRCASSVSLFECFIIEHRSHIICMCRQAEHKLGPTVASMIKELELSMGAQVFVIAGYRGSDGGINKTK